MPQIVDHDCRVFGGEMVGVRAVARPPPPSPIQAFHLSRARLSIEANPRYIHQTSINSWAVFFLRPPSPPPPALFCFSSAVGFPRHKTKKTTLPTTATGEGLRRRALPLQRDRRQGAAACVLGRGGDVCVRRGRVARGGAVAWARAVDREVADPAGPYLRLEVSRCYCRHVFFFGVVFCRQKIRPLWWKF